MSNEDWTYGNCESCDKPLDLDEAPTGVCDDCWQGHDEAGDE